jgi:putative transposase
MLASATDKQLAKQVQYLKGENEILRARLPEQMSTTPAERRRLLKLGRPLGAAIKGLITIVKPTTFAIWVRQARKNQPARKAGRPRTLQPIQDLILQIARETGWAYTRVLGELRKLTNRRVNRISARILVSR